MSIISSLPNAQKNCSVTVELVFKQEMEDLIFAKNQIHQELQDSYGLQKFSGIEKLSEGKNIFAYQCFIENFWYLRRTVQKKSAYEIQGLKVDDVRAKRSSAFPVTKTEEYPLELSEELSFTDIDTARSEKSSGSEKTSPRKSIGGEDMEDYGADFIPDQKPIATKKNSSY